MLKKKSDFNQVLEQEGTQNMLCLGSNKAELGNTELCINETSGKAFF